MKSFKIIAFFTVLLMLLTACNSDKNPNYAIKINNIEVSKSEFMLYFYETQKSFEAIGGNDIWETDFGGKTAIEAAKERALSSLKAIKIPVLNSGSLGISLSEDEILKIKEDAEKSFSKFTDDEKAILNLNLEQYLNIMQDKALYSKLYNEITKNYIINESDFNTYYTEYKDVYADILTKLKLRRIFVDEKSKAEEVITRYNNGEDFTKLFNEYEPDESIKKSDGILEINKGDFDSLFNTNLDIEAGEITEILEVPEGYFIFKLDEKTPLSEDEVRNAVKSYYESLMKQQLFNQEYEKWEKKVSVVKNDTFLKEIQLFDTQAETNP